MTEMDSMIFCPEKRLPDFENIPDIAHPDTFLNNPSLTIHPPFNAFTLSLLPCYGHINSTCFSIPLPYTVKFFTDKNRRSSHSTRAENRPAQ